MKAKAPLARHALACAAVGEARLLRLEHVERLVGEALQCAYCERP